jgi:hypothetical protein
VAYIYIFMTYPHSVLCAAAALLSLNNASGEGETALSAGDVSDYRVGCLLVVSASAISGLSGSLSQVALTSLSAPRHTAVFTIELAVYGMIFLFGRLLVAGDETKALLENGFFNGWTMYTMIPVLSNVSDFTNHDHYFLAYLYDRPLHICLMYATYRPLVAFLLGL